MPTQTNFELIYLGNLSDVDVVETGDGSLAENASDLLGTYGGPSTPLWEQQVAATFTDGDDDGVIWEDSHGGAGTDTLTVLDAGGNPSTYEIDSFLNYSGTITYTDGTTETAAFRAVQDSSGNVWLLPIGATSIQTKAIESVSLNSTGSNNSFGVTSTFYEGREFVCFATGTLIATPSGERPVETLGPGDLVTTLDHGSQPLLHRFSRRLDFTKGAPDSQKPVEIRPGTLGPGLPGRTLIVSPQHRVLIRDGSREVIAPAKSLVAACTARIRKGQRQVAYHALLFAKHQIIFAEGIRVESLYPGPQAIALLSLGQRMAIYADFPELLSDPESGYGPSARSIVTRRAAEAILKSRKPTCACWHLATTRGVDLEWTAARPVSGLISCRP